MDNIQTGPLAAISTKDEKLKEILLSKHKKCVEDFTYHCISVQDMYKEAIGELTSVITRSTNNGDIDWECDKKGKLLEIFVEVQNALKKYTFEMNKVFSCHYFMSEINLQKLESRACKRSASSEKDDPLLLWTINQYGNKYSEINKEVILSEQDILKNTVTPIVLQWYENEFLDENNCVLPREKHEMLKTTCKEGIKTCLSYSDNHIDLLKSTFDALDLELDQLYEKFKGNGKTRLKMASNNLDFARSTLKRPQKSIPGVVEDIPALFNEVTPTLAVEFDPYGIKCGIMGNGKLLVVTYENDKVHFPYNFDFDEKDSIICNGKLQESFSTTWNYLHPMKQPAENIQTKTSNGDTINIVEDFVCALTLEKVKRQAEMIFGRELKHVTIAVPLRYTTTKRQMIQNAAEIAGFKKVNLVTETTAAAIAYFRNPRKTSEDLRKMLLVLIHSKRHYDAALYKMENGVVKMVTCTGDSHNHKSNGERLEKHLVRKFKKSPVGVMIYRGNDQAVLESVSNQLSCNVEYVKNVVLLGAANYSELDSKNRIFLDLFPYKLKLKDRETKTTVLKIPRRSNFNETKNVAVVLKNLKATNLDKTIIATEEGKTEFFTGEFKIKGDHLLCTLDEEGILGISFENDLISNNFSLQPKDKEMYSSLLQQKVKQGELRILAEFLLKTSINIPKGFVREEVRSEAADALEFLNKGASSLENIQTKISFLKDLKDKYAK